MKTKAASAKADKAMRQIWKEWFTFYAAHFRGHSIAISTADQQAFYEIAQPILRELVAPDAASDFRQQKRTPATPERCPANRADENMGRE